MEQLTKIRRLKLYYLEKNNIKIGKKNCCSIVEEERVNKKNNNKKK